MTVPMILAPVFALVLLAAVVLFRLAYTRFRAVKAKEVRTEEGSPTAYRWPVPAQLASDNFRNQFEVPTLFYALVPLAILSHKADFAFVVMSWVFVASRWLHAFEHLGRNRLKFRFPAFVLGAVVLLVMWLIFAVRVLVVN